MTELTRTTGGCCPRCRSYLIYLVPAVLLILWIQAEVRAGLLRREMGQLKPVSISLQAVDADTKDPLDISIQAADAPRPLAQGLFDLCHRWPTGAIELDRDPTNRGGRLRRGLRPAVHQARRA